MTDNHISPTRQSFGVLAVLGESFSIFFRGFLFFAGTALLGQILMLALTLGLGMSTAVAFGGIGGSGIPQINSFVAALMAAGVIAIYSMVGAITSLGAFDMKMGKRTRFLSYVGTAFRSVLYILVNAVLVGLLFIIPIFLVTLVFSFLSQMSVVFVFILFPVMLAMIAYLFGMFSVVNPAIVLEGAGFSAISRSVGLTKDYRWAVTGLYIIFGIVVLVALVVFGGAIALVAAGGGLANTNSFTAITVLAQIFNLIVGAALTGFFGVLVAMVFARLKEIKEGFGFEDVGSIFD